MPSSMYNIMGIPLLAPRFSKKNIINHKNIPK